MHDASMIQCKSHQSLGTAPGGCKAPRPGVPEWCCLLPPCMSTARDGVTCTSTLCSCLCCRKSTHLASWLHSNQLSASEQPFPLKAPTAHDNPENPAIPTMLGVFCPRVRNAAHTGTHSYHTHLFHCCCKAHTPKHMLGPAPGSLH